MPLSDVLCLIALQLVIRNAGIAYQNPSKFDTCEQYNHKVLYGLQQQYGLRNVSLVNATAGRLVGPISMPVLVLDGRLNITSVAAAARKSNFTGEPGQQCSTLWCMVPGSRLVLAVFMQSLRSNAVMRWWVWQRFWQAAVCWTTAL